MVLDARTRSSIYTKLQPMLDEDEANALMSEFPASEADQLVTKQFLRADLAELDSRLTERMARQSHLLLTAVGVATAIIVAAGRI